MEFTPNLIEIWTLYGFGTLMVAARVYARTTLVGIRGYRPDDYLVWFAWAMYTTVSVIAHVFIMKAQGKHTSLLTPEQRATMPAEEHKSWEYGSQIFLIGFYSYVIIVWTLKLNMLFFYRRLVQHLWVERAILPAFWLVGSSAIAVILTFTLTCIPFYKFWQVFPDPGALCVPQNKVTFYTVLILNVVTDFFIFLIPIPVLAPLRVGILRKIGLYTLLGLGLFCMMAAILRVVLIFNLNQQGISAMWSIREDFVAMFVGQAPMVYPLFNRKFWHGTGNELTNSTGGAFESHQLRGLGSRKPNDPYSTTHIGATIVDGSESQEEMVKQYDASSGPKRQNKNRILVNHTYNVESIKARSDDRNSQYYQNQAY
ncbi:hypothetical protein V501_00815 [Pseudogymnoascus sp. VKM F-4519 (FW-2642)]|nr:hypothetical protein V501_00815 [Pseudogymnoascus sp. VKM F-4519 (FW-2642)]